MAIEIRERFCVDAPIDSVWRFVTDPEQLVTCMPGASLDEAVDATTYRGTVKVKLGAVTARYKGRVELVEVDDSSYTVRLVAEGHETSGGTARGTLSSRLTPLADGRTEVVTEGDVDLAGRVMQVGRGMIDGVSQQLFQQFAESTKDRLERTAQGGSADDVLPAGTTAGVAAEPEAVRILPLLLRTLTGAVKRLARKVTHRIGGRSRRQEVVDLPLAELRSSER